mgnify:CR=1 FL=1
MKFIGQYIQDFIARFRNDVYLESISSGTIVSGGNLGLDSNNKIVKASISASGLTVSSFNADAIITSSESFSDDDTTLMTSAAIDDQIQSRTSGFLSEVPVTVGNGGTGATSLTDNAVLLGNGSGAIEASSHLSYVTTGTNQDYLKIGDSSTTTAGITTDNASRLLITVEGSTGTNVAGNDITFTAGTSTGNAAGGDFTFRSCSAGSSGSSANIGVEIAKLDSEGNLQIDGGLTVGSTSFVNSSGVVQVATQSTIDHDSLANFVANEHIDWTSSSAGTIHSSNIPTLNQDTTGSAATTTGVQSGKNYRILNCSFRQDIGTSKYYLPLKSQDEQTVLTREEISELSVCDGRIVSVTLRVENLNTHTGDATVTFGVEANLVGVGYSGNFSVVETEALTINHADDHHVFHYVFDSAKHWDSTDMWAVSIQSDTDISGSNERFFVTVVVEDDWSTYLAGSSREIDSTP